MTKTQYNQLVARLVTSNRIATREQIKQFAAEITPERNLAQILVVRGLITDNQRKQIHAYIMKNADTGDAPPEPAPAKTPREPSAEQRHTPNQTAPSPTPASVESEPAPGAHPPEPSAKEASAQQERIAIKSRKTALPGGARESLPPEFREAGSNKASGLHVPTALTLNHSIQEMLIFARQKGASDLHLSPGNPVFLRSNGTLEAATRDTLRSANIKKIVSGLLTHEQVEELETTGDLELAYSIPDFGRHRVTVMEQRFGWDFSARIIDNTVRNPETCDLPPCCERLTKWAQGLVLITGPLGCGKSSTLAMLVEMVNRDRDEHIITIENPVEMLYKPAKCQITQREVGRHTLSPANALRGALRQDPDILVVSELRDLETIRLAVSAAETGHLVFGTMNTINARRTVDRLIDSFPPSEQDIMRTMISESLRGIISQQLIPRKDGRGMVAAFEVLLVNRAVSNLIRKSNTNQLEAAMMTGRQQGMVLLDESLKFLVDKSVISGEEAFFRASNPKVFKQFAPKHLQVVYDA